MNNLNQRLKNTTIKIKRKNLKKWSFYKVLLHKNDVIYLFTPKYKESGPGLEPGEEIEVVCPGDKGRVAFNSIVLQVKGNITSVLYQNQFTEVVQERKHVRAETNIPVRFHTVNLNGTLSNYCDGTICNLSEGGARLKTNIPLNKKTQLVLNIGIPDETGVLLKEESIQCKVVRYEVKEKKVYEAGLVFLDATPEQKQRMARFVFNMLLEEKKRDFDIDKIISFFE